MKSDELNKLFKNYFDEMEITEEGKQRRVEAALSIYDIVWYILTIMRIEANRRKLRDREEYLDLFYFRIMELLEGYDIPQDDPYITEYVSNMTSDIIDVTLEHLKIEVEELDEEDEDLDEEEEYFVSNKRAKAIALNEANSIVNYEDLLIAKKSGKKTKKWITQGDEKVRAWHEEVGKEEPIPIEDYFIVGPDRMLMPHDYVHGSAGNIIYCRCSCLYR